MITSLLFIISGQAYGWEAKKNSSGEDLHWNTEKIHFSLNTDGSHSLDPATIEEAISSAASSWNIGNISFVFDGETKNNSADYSDNVFSVYFSNNWTEDPEVLALTYTWSSSDGEIVHFDMEINTENHDWSTDGSAEKHDLQNAITHEFGHALGLDHSTDTTATMAPTATPGEISKRELAQDDINGYQHLYTESSNGGENNEGGTNNQNNTGKFSNDQNQNSSDNNLSQGGTYRVPLQNAGCSTSGSSIGWFGMLFGALFAFRRQHER